jgi:hypothetical protein
MVWHWDRLRLGLRGFPNVVVAAYQGLGDDQHGRLRVLARRGRWSDYDPLEPGSPSTTRWTRGAGIGLVPATTSELAVGRQDVRRSAAQ